MTKWSRQSRRTESGFRELKRREMKWQMANCKGQRGRRQGLKFQHPRSDIQRRRKKKVQSPRSKVQRRSRRRRGPVKGREGTRRTKTQRRKSEDKEEDERRPSPRPSPHRRGRGR